MCFSTDILHSNHIGIIKRAAWLGQFIIGVLSDEAVVSYKRFPLLPFEERRAMPIAIGLFIFSKEIILLFSGSGFASAGLTMRILTPIVVVIPFSIVTNQQIFVSMQKKTDFEINYDRGRHQLYFQSVPNL